MSTSTTFSNHSTLAENWDTETLINFLRDLNINLDEDDFKILRKKKIDGQIFSDMTEKKFIKDGMKRGPAMKLEKQAKLFKEKSRASEKGKIEYFGSFRVELVEKSRKPLADTSNLQEEIIEKPVSSKSDSLVSSTPIAKKRSISKVLDASADIPLRDDKSIDILKILKTAVRDFDQGIISLGSSRSYKSSNHLYVNPSIISKFQKESTYDAEMYRVLVNWLRKIHGYEITGQWHLEQVCDDGDYHHLYCDLTIKKPENPHLEALLELLATASISKLDGHFEQVFKYEEQLHPREIWIVHFSREDYVVTNPYWPSEKLQEKE
ncbi:hypothetical protein RclHR1_30330002 [Rhizophagus clarus]|uniref:SAM domain-containing protein n=1 Tax=Rhizophagus clarus TaxID=94130 RepID=A0A2Z6R616_9GLOM|nr:hypothetical protein RclHR1_30330002 [Rhizophagus clarus]